METQIYSEIRAHQDKVTRNDLREKIGNGVKCVYSYTHYEYQGRNLKNWDDRRPLTKEEALQLLDERDPRKLDGFRFSPSRCFLYGYVRALSGAEGPFIMFSEADRKPTSQEQFDVHDGIKNPEDVTPRTKYCHVEQPIPGFYAVCIRRPMTEEVRRCTEKREAESICAKIDAEIQAAAQDMATYDAIEQVMQNLHLVI